MSFTNPFRDRTTPSKKRAFTSDDIRAAVERACREQFGQRAPIRVENSRGNTIFIRVPSSPWKAEILWNEQDILSRARKLLGENTRHSDTRRIVAVL